MNKKLVSEFKEKLLEEKKDLEKILSSFAEKDRKLKSDWDTRFPQFGKHTSEQDENIDEVEEYTNLLPIEEKLELQLLDIERALVKIKKGRGYGVCENCGEKIEEARLKIIPETKFCSKHAKKVSR